MKVEETEWRKDERGLNEFATNGVYYAYYAYETVDSTMDMRLDSQMEKHRITGI